MPKFRYPVEKNKWTTLEVNYDLGNRLFVLLDGVEHHQTLYSKSKLSNMRADTLVLFEKSEFVTITIGSIGTDASIKGTVGAVSMRCGTQENSNSNPKNMFQAFFDVTETKLKGLWYFDENSLPRPNLANPYNLEPWFKAHVTNPPVWSGPPLNRWIMHDDKKVVLEFGNFLDFSPSDLVRTFSIALDIRFVNPFSGSI